MDWEIDFEHLLALHPSGLQVHLVPDGKRMYFFKPVGGTEHHLENIPAKNLCMAELAAALARFLEASALTLPAPGKADQGLPGGSAG